MGANYGSHAAGQHQIQVVAGHQQAILASHERCGAFGLVAHQPPDLKRLDHNALRDLQQRNARLCAQAMPVLDMLYEQLTHAQSMVLLTDASGVILHALGDAGFLDRAQQIALAPGALWAEADKGTNAVGTALMTESPTLVHGQEHYLRAMQFLTCSAAPIFDHKGALLGVIDVSGDRRSYHPHTLALAGMSARLIENQWFADKFRHSLRLHFHANAVGLGTLHEGVLALDEDGRVLGANRRAIELLGHPATHLRREGVQSLFDAALGPLIDHARTQPDEPLLLARALLGSGPATVFAKLSLGSGTPSSRDAAAPSTLPQAVLRMSPPPSVASPPIVPSIPIPVADAAPTLRAAELLAIQAAVRNSGGNLSLAARQLGIGRSTLYRKLKAESGAKTEANDGSHRLE